MDAFESLEEIADYGSQVKIALEYKLKEPRQYLLVGNAFRALYLIKTLNRKNLGVTVDFGHAHGQRKPRRSGINSFREKAL